MELFICFLITVILCLTIILVKSACAGAAKKIGGKSQTPDAKSAEERRDGA